MTVLRPWRRAITRRVTFIDTYDYPRTMSDLRAHLSAGEVPVVEAGLRQWFRLAARHPRAELTMPSVVVGDLWHGMARRASTYDEFCAAAFGRPFPYAPDRPDRPDRLALTYRLAREEEANPLPLLFRVDAELKIEDGRHYLPDCGGRGVCYDQPGLVCLRHLDGVGRPVRGEPEARQLGYHPPDGSGFVGGDG